MVAVLCGDVPLLRAVVGACPYGYRENFLPKTLPILEAVPTRCDGAMEAFPRQTVWDGAPNCCGNLSRLAPRCVEILLARWARASRKRDRKTPLLRLGAVLSLLAFDFILEKFLRGCRGNFFKMSPYAVPYAVPPRKRAAPWLRGGSE